MITGRLLLSGRKGGNSFGPLAERSLVRRRSLAGNYDLLSTPTSEEGVVEFFVKLSLHEKVAAEEAAPKREEEQDSSAKTAGPPSGGYESVAEPRGENWEGGGGGGGLCRPWDEP